MSCTRAYSQQYSAVSDENTMMIMTIPKHEVMDSNERMIAITRAIELPFRSPEATQKYASEIKRKKTRMTGDNSSPPSMGPANRATPANTVSKPNATAGR